jgi:hypothetical protein
MNDALRLVLLLAIAAIALTAIGGLVARSLDPQRRLKRYLRQALGAEPEGVMLDRGLGRALAFNIDAGKVCVLWDKGRKGLIYKTEQLMGGELMVDHEVLARCYRGEPRKLLDEIPMSARKITLRLIFDNPRDPEYELELWPARHGRGHEYPSPADAVMAGRRWITALEAIVRLPSTPARMLTRPAPLTPTLPDEDEPPPWDEDDQDI